MVSPNPTTAATGAGGVPPGPYDPYKALIEALPLSDDIFRLLKPAFDQLGATLEKDVVSVTDLSKNPLPHYRVVTQHGNIVLLHLKEDVAADQYGQRSLFTIAWSFLKDSRALFVFSEVDSFAFNTEDLVSIWQQTQPKLKAGFISLPLIQQLESELDEATRIQNIKALLGLDDLLLASQLPLEDAIEKAYQQARLDILDNLTGLPERLTEADRNTVIEFIVKLAIAPPLRDSTRYLSDLLAQLDLEQKPSVYLVASFKGNAYTDAEVLFFFLEERTYPAGKLQGGYRRVLGYLLSLLSDQGGGKQMALIIFKYKLVADDSVLRALVAKYP